MVTLPSKIIFLPLCNMKKKSDKPPHALSPGGGAVFEKSVDAMQNLDVSNPTKWRIISLHVHY